jgi:hypothetical protein
VFAEGAVEGAAKAGAEGLEVEGAGEVALVEEGYDFVYWVLGHVCARRRCMLGVRRC